MNIQLHRCPYGQLACPGGELCVCAIAVLGESFKDAPRSLGEVRSDKTMSCKDWTPRDALISMLRQIDNGLQVTDLVICYGTKDQGTAYSAACSSGLVAHGLLARTHIQMER